MAKTYDHSNEKVITELYSNYTPALSDGKEIFRESMDMYVVGMNGVIQIEEHIAGGEGDKFFYDVIYTGGRSVIRIFNPHQIKFQFVNS